VSTITTGSGLTVHPRMRLRRIEVRRDAGRRRLKRVAALLGVVVAVLALATVIRSPLLDVDHVRAAGGEHTSAAAIRATAGIGRGQEMVGVDTGAAERRIEALPWVDEATVTRRWPGTVEVRVTERTATAAVRVTDTRWAQVDETGRVLAVREAPAAGMPAVRGVAGRIVEGEPLPRGADEALRVLDAVTGVLPEAVTEVGTDLDVTLGYGTTVRFGSIDELDEKVAALDLVFDRVDLSCLAVIDLRAPDSPALTRYAGCS
jgi:cell division protein FtsQ